MKTTPIASGLALLALTTGLAGCGSGSSTKSTTATTPTAGLSRAELVAKANMICATARSQAAPYPAPANIATDAAAAAAYFDKIFPITDAQTKALQALPPAADVAGDWRAFVDAQVAADQLLQMLKQRADAQDPKGIALLAKEQPAGQRIAAAASRLGANTCAGR
jgi:hypothetical protein